MGNCTACANFCDQQEFNSNIIMEVLSTLMSYHKFQNAPKAQKLQEQTVESMNHSAYNIMSAVNQSAIEEKIIKIQSHIRGHQTRRYLGLTYYKQMINQSTSCKYFTKEEAQETISNRPFNPNLKREKRSPYRYRSGAVYEGEWLGGFRDGFGQMTWPDGATYIGNWKLNKAQGKGQFLHAEGDIYDGEWFNDKANGYGVYQHINGALYQGEWKEDLQHGQGYEKWVDGSSFLGQYAYGQKDGYGLYKWADGSDYEGQWKENKINGVGVYTWLDGRNYEGEWKNNNMDGVGCYQWSDGRQYEGEYEEDKKHGFGIYHWADGRIYMGYWNRGKQHGLGSYKTPNDKEFRYGLWEEGKRAKWFNENEVAAICNKQLDYLQFFNLAQSGNFVDHTANFNPPPHFELHLRKVKLRIMEVKEIVKELKSKSITRK